jgi:hypothetical protein
MRNYTVTMSDDKCQFRNMHLNWNEELRGFSTDGSDRIRFCSDSNDYANNGNKNNKICIGVRCRKRTLYVIHRMSARSLCTCCCYYSKIQLDTKLGLQIMLEMTALVDACSSRNMQFYAKSRAISAPVMGSVKFVIASLISKRLLRLYSYTEHSFTS